MHSVKLRYLCPALLSAVQSVRNLQGVPERSMSADGKCLFQPFQTVI